MLKKHFLTMFALMLLVTNSLRAEVGTILEDWNDTARNRNVPVKIYYPKDATAASPIVIFSHGLGGSREGYSYLGKYWADHGYISVHLQHIGSDDSAWKNARPLQRMPAMKDAANYENYMARIKDVPFAIDQLTKINADKSHALTGRLNLDKIVMAGHSFGAKTTQAVIGETVTIMGKEISYVDPRIKCAIVMSPSPQTRNKESDTAFAKISIPVFYMTGTQDVSPIGDTSAEDRVLPYQHSKGKDQYLLVFKNGDHMVFGGGNNNSPRAKADVPYDKYHEIILTTTTAFMDTYLGKKDATKPEALPDFIKKTLGDSGELESR